MSKSKSLILACVLMMSGCALWGQGDKTPLTPLGELNVCLRDEVNSALQDGTVAMYGNEATVRKVAETCLKKLKISDEFLQNTAYRNATALLTQSVGTSLK